MHGHHVHGQRVIPRRLLKNCSTDRSIYAKCSAQTFQKKVRILLEVARLLIELTMRSLPSGFFIPVSTSVAICKAEKIGNQSLIWPFQPKGLLDLGINGFVAYFFWQLLWRRNWYVEHVV